MRDVVREYYVLIPKKINQIKLLSLFIIFGELTLNTAVLQFL